MTDLRTGRPAIPRLPDDRPVGEQPDVAAAEWICDNSLFAYNVTNRVWTWLVGTPLVSPVDDQRATNPSINPELHAWLTQYFVREEYSLTKLVRAITLSRAYARAVDPEASPLQIRLCGARAVKNIDIPLTTLLKQTLLEEDAQADSFAHGAVPVMQAANQEKDSSACTRGSKCWNPIRKSIELAAGRDLEQVIVQVINRACAQPAGRATELTATGALEALGGIYRRMFGQPLPPDTADLLASQAGELDASQLETFMADVVWSWAVSRSFGQLY